MNIAVTSRNTRRWSTRPLSTRLRSQSASHFIANCMWYYQNHKRFILPVNRNDFYKWNLKPISAQVIMNHHVYLLWVWPHQNTFLSSALRCVSFLNNNLLMFACSDRQYNIDPMPASRLSALEQIQEIRDYLSINAKSPDFKSLWFLKNLRIIRGQNLKQYVHLSLLSNKLWVFLTFSGIFRNTLHSMAYFCTFWHINILL